jgi:hypothetical protein
MAQVQRATSKEGKEYLTSTPVANEDEEIKLKIHLPKTITELTNITSKGQKGIRFGENIDPAGAFITCVDLQYLTYGTEDVKQNEAIRMSIRATNQMVISSNGTISISANEDNISLTCGDLKINDETGVTVTQTFKDAAGVNKTMTITNGIITDIS